MYNFGLTNIDFVFEGTGFGLFFLGFAALLDETKMQHILNILLTIELMFYGINYYLLELSTMLNDIEGLIVSFFILTLAASESALALGLLMAYFKIFKNILL
jgi:NADH-quinone oxidoreductase subunit K